MAKHEKNAKARLKKCIKETKKSKDCFKSIIEKNKDGLIVVDKDKKVCYINPAGEVILNLKKEEITGNLFPYSFTTEEKIELKNNCNGRATTVEMYISETSWEEKNAFLLTLKEKLKITEENKESLNKEKEQFLAHISHEIRTPMTGIVGITDLMLETELSEKQKEYIEIIRQSGSLILSLINRLLKHSKIEAKKLELEEVNFNIYDTVMTTVKTFIWQAEKKDIKLTCHIEENIPDLLGDPECLKQVIINLVGNAIKFTSNGEIKVTVEKIKEDCKRKNILLHFSVSDTGIGIPADKTDNIFKSYVQVDNRIKSTYGGTGLGLSIVKEIIGLMGGNIQVESQVGEGSNFHFTACFKIGKKETSPPQVSSEKVAPSFNILLVEDDIVNQRVATAVLEQAGHRVITAGNGKEALQEMLKTDFDIVFMDIKMPVLNGLEATKLIRSSDISLIKSNVPIIALTAHNRKGDREKFIQSGMDDYLTKPISKKSLLEIIEKFTGPLLEKGKPEEIKPDNKYKYIIDKDGTMERLGHDEELVKEMWEIFIEEGPKKLELITGNLNEKDYSMAEINAHALKAASINIGAEILAKKAYNLEKALEKKEYKSTKALYREVEEEVEKALGVLNILVCQNLKEEIPMEFNLSSIMNSII